VATEAVTRRLLTPARDESLAARGTFHALEVCPLDLGGHDLIPALRADRVHAGENLRHVDLPASRHLLVGLCLQLLFNFSESRVKMANLSPKRLEVLAGDRSRCLLHARVASAANYFGALMPPPDFEASRFPYLIHI